MSDTPVKKTKITYSSKARRRREDARDDDDSSYSDVASIASAKTSPSKTSPSKTTSGKVASMKGSGASMGPPDSAFKKSVTIDSPSRIRPPGEPDNTTPAKKSAHFRKPSLPAGRFAAPGSTSSPGNSSSAKPLSFVGVDVSPALKRAKTPSEHGGGGQKRRSEGERLRILEEDKNCEIIDPHQVKCKKCLKEVKLGRPQTYTLKPWQRHRNRCDKTENDETVEDESEADDAASSIAPSISVSAMSENSKRTTAAERKAMLEDDPRAEEVQPKQVLCRKCQKWVQLRKSGDYILGAWTSHQSKCSDTSYVPSDRVATAERKLRIVNDSQAKGFTSRSVECGLCGTNVQLDGEGEYNLTQWEHHKTSCPSPSKLKSDESPSHPPASTASTEETVVASDASPTGPRGVKRPRDSDPEEQDEPKDDTEPLTNKPRAEGYEPPEDKSPGVLGWFLTPFKAFARGFQEGLSSSDP